MISNRKRGGYGSICCAKCGRRSKDSLAAPCSQKRPRMEEEVRDILRNAANESDDASGGLGTEIAALFSRVGIDFEIPELRGHAPKPPSFEE